MAALAAGGGVLVSGPAGIGKSALLDAIGSACAAAGQLVLRSASAAAESWLPYLGLYDLFSDAVAARPEVVPYHLRPAFDGVLMRTVPDGAATDQLAIRVAVVEALRALSAERPVLLILDDVNCLDSATAEVLAFAVRRRQGSRVHVLAAERLSEGQEPTWWGLLPEDAVEIALGNLPGPVVSELLRTRLGLPPAGGFDAQLAARVTEYQRAHGLDADGVVGKGTIASLNLGADYYERRIAINMERAWRLPATRAFDRYVVIDSSSAQALLFDRDRLADSMRVVVGSPKTKTPMMAVLMRDAKVHPYWNVPPDLIKSLTATRVLEQGLSYLDNFHYEVLANWSPGAPTIDPKTVPWKQIGSGKVQPTVLVRQLPGPWNSMGDMKFEMPNDYGIYMHDTPHKELFAEEDRHLSNGCIRLADYRRFAAWVFGCCSSAARMSPACASSRCAACTCRIAVWRTWRNAAVCSGSSLLPRGSRSIDDSRYAPSSFRSRVRSAPQAVRIRSPSGSCEST